jgi:ATP-binding cassette subfamily B multidrug efflux pump
MRTDFGHSEEEKLGKPYDWKLLKRLLPFAKPYKIRFVAVICLVMVITLLDLARPYIIKITIDRYIVPVSQVNPKNPAAAGTTHKFLTVDFADPQVRKLVKRYPHQFQETDSTVKIAYKDLAQLPQKDIKRLRGQHLKGIAMMAAIFLAIVFTGFGAHCIQAVMMEYAGQKIMHDLRMRLYVHLQGRSVAFFSKNPVGRLVTRVTNDIQNMDELFTSVIVFVCKDVVLLAGICVVLIGIDLWLALISFTVMPFVFLASIRFSSLARDAFRELRVRIAQINTRFAETVSGISVIQLFREEAGNFDRFKNLNHDNYLAGMRQIRIFAVFMPVIELLGSVALALVIYQGGRGVLAERITLGDLVAFITYIKMFFRPIRDIAEKYNVLQNAMASAERIFLLLDDRNALQAPTQTLPGHLSADADETIARLDKIEEMAFENVTFAYDSNVTVLWDISFAMRAGETIAIVGPTGSGKTSLIQLIIRFYDPTSGRITINGLRTGR